MSSLADRLIAVAEEAGRELNEEDRIRWQPAIVVAANLQAEILQDQIAGRDPADKVADFNAQMANIGVGSLLVARRKLSEVWGRVIQEVLSYGIALISVA